MLGVVETVRPADFPLQGNDAGALELHHPAAVGADQVVVLLPGVQVLVAKAALPQTLAADQPARNEQVEIPVDGRAGDLGAFGPHRLEELIGVDVAMLREDAAKQRQSLRSHPHAASPQEGEKLVEFVLVLGQFSSRRALLRQHLNSRDDSGLV